jgi:serine/threonine protein kinase
VPDPLDATTERALVDWVETRLRAGDPAHARGYQGSVYLYGQGGRRLIVKVAPGRGVHGRLQRWMLRREHDVYRRLAGFAGSPRCHGLLRGRYLVLDYIDAASLRAAPIVDPGFYFDTLLLYIKELHERGVAHADLKRRDNLLVIDGRRPCLIDFGAAVVRKPGFAPINHYLYRLAARFDFNAWAKLKYGGRFEDMTAADRVYYHRTRIERIARALKRSYLKLKSRITD